MAGNATVTLIYNNTPTQFEIWIQTLSTNSQNEFASQQVRGGMSWSPIRRAERYFNFTAVWSLISVPQNNKPRDVGFEDIDPADGFAKMNKFQDAIRSHHMSIANGSTVEPMVVNYYNNSDATSPLFNTLISKQPLTNMQMPYQGFIQTVEKQYVRFQNVFTTNYTMHILNPNVSNTAPTTLTVGGTYAPTSADQSTYGGNWILMTGNGGLVAVANNISGMPSNNG